MKILIFGDVYGRVWRNALKKELPKLKAKFNPDFTIVNVENITSWRGPIEKHVKEVEKLGIDAVSYTHLRAHETLMNLVCRLLLEKSV